MKYHKILASILLAAATSTAQAQKLPELPVTSVQVARAPISGIDMTAIDRKVRPQDDFFRYVNGTWLEETEIPSDKSRYSMFSVISDEVDKNLQNIIQDAAKSQAVKGSNEQKLGDMYLSFMDEERIEELGLQPITEELQDIQEMNDLSDVAATMGELFLLGVTQPFGFYVYPDAKNPQVNGFWLYQSGLTLPDRDYYLKDEEKYQKYRADYKKYIEELLLLANYTNPARAAERVLRLETLIAEKHISRTESRDAEKNYNKRSIEEVRALLAGLDWDAYAAPLGIANVDEAIVRNYPYFEALGDIIASTDVDVWKDYLTFHLLDSAATSLPESFVDLHFAFHSTTLKGVPENQKRWKRGVDATSGALGEVLGQEYVARHFKPEAKAKMETLVQNLIKAYGASIKELEWMSAETKVKALEKLANFKPKVGYPDKWRDYSALQIDPAELMGNLKRSSIFETEHEVSKIGKAVDPVDWGMTPQTVNAYYSPTRNEIVFPAAILQPPFFNLDADDAVNYGGIGGVIGHEIGHGFDDQGSKYDGGGNLKSWWTDEDRKAFDILGDRFVAQYDEYSPIEGLNVNGRLTLGENIGDLAGVAIGYKAYQMSLQGKPAPVIDGLTGPQRFFMGWAQVWRSKMREDALRARIVSDPHSPAQYRVLGPLKNVDAFYQAFDLKEGDEMYLAPKDRVKIW